MTTRLGDLVGAALRDGPLPRRIFSSIITTETIYARAPLSISTSSGSEFMSILVRPSVTNTMAASIFSHKGLLGDKLSGKALTIGVCATASSGFFLLGYDREF